jgi:CSLREA domain-containing protein
MSAHSFLRRQASRRGRRSKHESLWGRPALERLEDRTLLSTLTVNSIGDGNVRDQSLTLREGLLLANGALAFSDLTQEEKNQVTDGIPGSELIDMIEFNIDTGGLKTIQLTSPFPAITHPVIIDGTSQPLYVDKPLIELDGSLAGSSGSSTPGLVIDAAGVTVRGLVIHSFAGHGIVVRGPGGAQIEGNYIGTDVTGLNDLGNGFSGVNIFNSPGNIVGGTTVAERNVISGNGEDGVAIVGGKATGNLVLGNYIGTDVTGMNDLGNTRHGVLMTSPSDPAFGTEAASGNTIGGETAEARNVISGNGQDGVQIAFGAHNNQVEGNFIGTKANGVEALGNSRHGVAIFDSSANTIGGLTLVPGTAPGNVISANRGDGVFIGTGAAEGNVTDNYVQGNLIGTDKNGDFRAALGNGFEAPDKDVFHGVEIRNASSNEAVVVSGNLIGGADIDDGQEDGVVKARNIISGNFGNGILVAGPRVLNTIVRGNYIGTNKDGMNAVNNLHTGIAVNSITGQSGAPSRTRIGGTAAGAGNVISGNDEDGVLLANGSTQTFVFGNLIGTGADGLKRLSNGRDGVLILHSSANTIGGITDAARNVISANKRYGVEIVRFQGGPATSGNTVSGNYIGTDKSGAVTDPDRKPNSGDELGNLNGIVIQNASDNTIGRGEDGGENIIGGNLGDDTEPGAGVGITGSEAKNNRVQGNLIGVGADGARVGNRIGVLITRLTGDGSPSDNVIGGTQMLGDLEVPLSNVISANLEDGVQIAKGATHNQVTGNFIGTNFDGTAVLGNGRGVAIIDASSNTIGGTTDARRNVIVNNQDGIFISDPTATGNVVQGNYIGISLDSLLRQGNTRNGVLIANAPKNTIGGSMKGARNVISGNGDAGVRIVGKAAIDNHVLGNYIGTDPSGDQSRPNEVGGVLIVSGETLGRPSANVIGGVGELSRNVISGNKQFGVGIFGSAGSPSSSNVLKNNYIGTNAQGLVSLPNLGDGIHIVGSPGTIIGDGTPDARNVIAGNQGNGIFLTGFIQDTQINGNYIGTDKDAAKPLANDDGVALVADQASGSGPTKTSVTGNIISGNRMAGIRIDGNNAVIDSGISDNKIQDNIIGTNADSINTIPNHGFGIMISDSPRNVVGGTKANQSNTIAFTIDPQNDPDSGSGHGIFIRGKSATDNRIDGNLISSNAGSGVKISEGASHNFVGAGRSNVIILNHVNGVSLSGDDTSFNTVAANRIGIDESGLPMGNAASGVRLSLGAHDNRIGGVGPSSSNIISANRDGVLLQLSHHNDVVGNFIGTDVSGGFLDSFGNTSVGIGIVDAHHNTIGGETDETGFVPGNTILGNGIGVAIAGGDAQENTIQGNAVANNKQYGIEIFNNASNNHLGGLKNKAANRISNNGKAGVFVDSGTGNSIQHNQIFANTGLGIDLGPEGVTANDGRDKDVDTGANNLQNFPELAFATTTGSHRIVGTLKSAPATTYMVEFFATKEPDPSGFGEAERFVTSTTLTSNTSGIAFFDVALPDSEVAGTFLTATATDPQGNTSEFSKCVKIETDTDGDGISDAREAAGPNGGDGNQDGVPDSQQATVASFPNAENGAYVTLAAPEGARLSNVRPLENPSPDDAPLHVSQPLGFFDFTVTGVRPGAAVDIRMFLPEGSDPHYYFRYGPTPDNPKPHWYEWLFDGQTGATINQNPVILHFVDGRRGDDDLAANGSIADAGAPGFPDDLTVINTLDSGPGSLRQAISNANANPGADVITFNVLDPGPLSIQPLSALPAITDAVIIDGSTQPGFVGRPLVELDGSLAGPGVNGLKLAAGFSTIQGLAINRFSGAGIRIESGDSNLIAGNFIGTDVTGAVALGNGSFGVDIADTADNSIGGSEPGTGNVISGNAEGGIFIHGGQASLNSVFGNLIGTQVDGVSPLGNSGPGVVLDENASFSNLASDVSGTGNTIAFNAGAGVLMRGGTGNLVQANAIFANEGLGIDLGGDGVTANDVDDSDTGPNDLLNYPVLTHVASYGGRTYLAGSLTSTPGSFFTLDFYASGAADPSGFGEGQSFFGSLSVTTDAAGQAAFDVSFARSVAAGSFVTATARDVNGNTSEFSAALAVPVASTLIFTVNTTDDVDDGVADQRHTSLREAILAANRHPGADIIRFNIPGQNRTISPLGPLPDITDPVTIDGTTQPGFKGLPLIELEGSKAGAGADGLRITGGGSVVRGLVINRFQTDPNLGTGGHAITLQGLGGNRIERNFLDTDITGTNALPNPVESMFLDNSPDNQIGGTTAEAGNVILTVHMLGAGATGNRLQGNYIGTDLTGTARLERSSFIISSVKIDGISSFNTIGGVEPGAGNLVAGGLLISGDSNVVQGNLIGTDVTGTVYLRLDTDNLSGDVLLFGGTNNLIGGTTAAARNIIPGGVVVAGTRNLVQGNYIGTDITGTVALAKIGDPQGIRNGVSIAGSFNTIGGNTPGAGNLISGFGAAGVVFSGNNNFLQGNRIGTDATGTQPLGNNVGVQINFGYSNNAIGGATPGAGNLISGNALYGLRMLGGRHTTVQGNFIGTDRAGTHALGNLLDGLLLSNEKSATIGGFELGAGNVISGNGGAAIDGHGINIDIFTTGTVVQGNFIGTDVTGTLPLGNRGDGILIHASQNNLIGGSLFGAANLISANGGNGVSILDFEAMRASTGNVVQGNKIGTDVTGAHDLGNAGDGVSIITSSYVVGNNTVGGPNSGVGLPDAGNVIAFNRGNGVSALFSSGNTIQGNAIFANAGPGIVADVNGVLSTYAEDRGLSLSTGIPVLTSALFDTQGTIVEGMLTGAPFTRYALDFFANDAVSPSGFGTGQTVLESITFRTDAAGSAQFRIRLELPVPVGQWITATATDLAGNTSQFSRAVPVVTATDANTVQFTAPAYLVTENGAAAVVIVTRGGSTAGTITVDYATRDGSATAGADYTATSGTLTFNDGEASKTLTIPIQEDGITEGDEHFGIFLTNPAGASLGSLSEAAVTIADNDAAGQVQFSSSASSTFEGVVVTLLVTRTGGSRGRISVDYRVTAGTATPLVIGNSLNTHADYQDFFGRLIFEDGQTTAQIVFSTFKDLLSPFNPGGPVFDGPRTIEVTLGNPTGGATLGPVTKTVVTMTDDEDLHGGFFFDLFDPASVLESAGSVTFRVHREFNTTGTVSVDFATRDGTATAGSDYRATTGTLTFLPGQTLKTISIPILDDALPEDPEAFQVVLSNPTGGAILYPPGGEGIVRSVLIVDNDRADPGRFVLDGGFVHENAGTASIIVERRDGSTGVATVAYATSDGTALAGSDYTASSGTLTFNSGETRKTITIPILRDSLIEGDETFFVTLGNPTGGAAIASDKPAVVTIFETPGQFQFSASDYRVVENNAGFTVTVTLAWPSVPNSFPSPLTVDYTVHDGTAHAGDDYSAISGTLTFIPFETRKTITIPILNDSLVEDDETILLTLSNPTGGASLGVRSAATLSILDEDFDHSTVQVGAGGPYTISEGEGLTLSAVVTSGKPADFSWDINGDGVFGDAIGPNPTLSWAQLQALGIVDGPSRFEVRVRAKDSGGQDVSSAATSLTVNDLAPTLTLSGAGSSDEGSPYSLNLASADPGTDTIDHWTITWGDGATETVSGNPSSVTHTYVDGPNSYTITASATDEDGTYSAGPIALTVRNVPPTMAPLRNLTGSEGQSVALSATFADAGTLDTHTASISWGDGSSSAATIFELAGSGSLAATHVYADNGSYTIALLVEDQDKGSASQTVTATIANVAPSVVPAPAATVLRNTPVTMQVASFTDPGFTSSMAGTQETFTATIDWGDGTGVVAGSVSVTQGSAGVLTTGAVSGTHTYAGAGDYDVRVTVADDDGDAQSASFTVHVQAPSVKFFVVDQSAHQTFRYSPAGKAIDQSDLEGKNSRPRGAASNAAGDTLWVVDADKNVYVYAASGSLLGSWPAGNLNQPQDITTNGTDIWIVDNATDRVYRYANAAKRRSGSQTPLDSFALDCQDNHPSGIVTDGKTLWVTDDFNHKNNVFVYSTAGTRLGAWLLDPANDSPSGITLNPGGGTDLWVVDRHDAVVYHYAGATTRRTGNQTASDSFTLAAKDQHPEGIADPPPLIADPIRSSATYQDSAGCAERIVAALATTAGRGQLGVQEVSPWNPAPVNRAGALHASFAHLLFRYDRLTALLNPLSGAVNIPAMLSGQQSYVPETKETIHFSLKGNEGCEEYKHQQLPGLLPRTRPEVIDLVIGEVAEARLDEAIVNELAFCLCR